MARGRDPDLTASASHGRGRPAVRDDALVRRPFDHYGRYRLAAEVVARTSGGRPGRVLDVGGGPGSLAAFAPSLFPRTQVVASDLLQPGDWFAEAPSLVLADGAALPFGDGTFDAVVTLDTLEHVPPDRRTALLHELVRAARSWVLVVCPCATPGVADADRALLAVVRHRFGDDFPTTGILNEHLEYGHPDPDDVIAALEGAGADVARLPSGRLDRWLPMMLLFYDLLALGDDEPVELVQAAYNRVFWRDDLRGPAYRQAFVCRLPGADGPSAGQLAAALAPPDPQPPADLSIVTASLGAGFVPLLERAHRDLRTARAEVGRVEAELADREARICRLEARTGAAEARAAEAESRAAGLEAFRERVLSHPALRARRVLRRALRRRAG